MPILRQLSDEQWRRALVGCAFAIRGQRVGYVAFSVPCVAKHLAGDTDVSVKAAMRRLRRLAQEHGGEVVEDEVLWLPADEFERLWSAR